MKTLKPGTVMPAVHFLQCRSCAWCHGLLVLPQTGTGAGFQSPQAGIASHLAIPLAWAKAATASAASITQFLDTCMWWATCWFAVCWGFEDSCPPTYSMGHIRPEVWPSMKSVFLYGEQGEYFVFYVKIIVFIWAFTLHLCYYTSAKEEDHITALVEIKLCALSCESTLETQQLFCGLGVLSAFWGLVREGNGISQQIALDLNSKIRCNIKILSILHFPDRLFSKLFQRKWWSNQALLSRQEQRSWEVAHAFCQAPMARFLEA